MSEGFTAGDYVLLRVTPYALVHSLIYFCIALYISICVVTASSKRIAKTTMRVDEESADEFRAMLDPANSKYCPWPPTEWAEQEEVSACDAKY